MLKVLGCKILKDFLCIIEEYFLDFENIFVDLVMFIFVKWVYLIVIGNFILYVLYNIFR